ncbi:hypothetical protein HMP0015_1174 [Acinetobacter haemolyticus ATCC 19194]|uniref:Uncharacterized protein n=1 Tax=Acinetobacter haemolyticus ATCC 19194 TaxID=707232 RepID=D4XN82_ACIHA|nr:hypothetical protein HMP0015_1174 [Acinetobacter haemolyticus ATCC 19194]
MAILIEILDLINYLLTKTLIFSGYFEFLYQSIFDIEKLYD